MLGRLSNRKSVGWPVELFALSAMTLTQSEALFFFVKSRLYKKVAGQLVEGCWCKKEGV